MKIYTQSIEQYQQIFRSAFILTCVSLTLFACSDAKKPQTITAPPVEIAKPLEVSSESGQKVAADTVEVTKDSFKCLTEMIPVRGFFVDNLLGNLDGTLVAAESPNGAVYPVGSVVQLVPTEVMVKRENGYNATTKDWEFFELAVSPTGSEITVHGAFEVVNKFGGNCFGCHIKAEPQWDMICEQDHGCDPITFKHEGKDVTLTQEMIKGVQRADPRCVLANDELKSV
ncbi:MAG: hypothetical protein ACI88A_000854 [Paraglaciecola sp.]|jgi:hypothetical protein